MKISHLLQKKIVGAFLFFLSSSFIFTGLSLEATIDRLPDLYVYVIGIEPRNPCVNDAITFTVEVKNSGTATAAASKLRLGIGGGPPVILSVPPIDPGKYENVSTTKSLSIAQQYIATAMVDYDNKVVESNEGNNEKSRDFKVIGPCCADLRPYLMWVDPSHPTTQNIFSINVWIRNIGNKTSSPTTLEVTVGGSTKPYVFSVPAISSKDQRMFKQDIIFDRPGQYRAQFNVDPQNNVAECNKQNNIGILNFEVTGSSQGRLPDLYVYVIGIEPRNPCVNDAITFTVEVKNSGTATAAASKLRLGIGGGPPVILSVPPIDPGKYENVSTTKSLSIAQQYIATAMVDYDNKVVESNEGNNEKSRDFKVIGPCCADLRPYLMWVDPPHPTTQNIFSINVWIRNIGNKTSSPTMLEVTVGGSTKPYVFSVPAISSKDQRMFKQDIIFDRPGQYRAQFNVDPQNNVAECNKQNNIGILNFEVK